MLTLLFFVHFVYLVVKHLDSLEAVSDFLRHCVDVLGKFKFEFSLLGIFEVAFLRKTWWRLIGHSMLINAKTPKHS